MAYEEQRVLDKMASSELQEKYRKQDLTHDHEAGGKHIMDAFEDEDELEDDYFDEKYSS